MIRIGFVNYDLGPGGIETLILRMCKRIRRDGFQPEVFVLQKGGLLEQSFEESGIPVHTVQKRGRKDPSLIFRIAGKLRQSKIDVVHTHNSVAWFHGGLAARLARLPLVHTEHTSPDHNPERWRRIERLLSFVTHRITAVSGSVARFMIEREHISSQKIQVVYNGIDPRMYEKETDRRAKRKEIGLRKGDRAIGMVARLFPQKDHRTLLEAFGLVVKQEPHARLLIIGEGPLRQELEHYGREQGLDGSVRFLGVRRDIPELLQVLDLAVLSTHKEGFPMVLLEAMASSVPVVASGVDGNPELVVQGKTGLLVPPRDPKALAESILSVLKDPVHARHMGTQGAKRVRASFTFEKMVRSYENIYRSFGKK